METIAVEQIENMNAKSQKRKYPDLTADNPIMESGACPPFINHQNKMKIEIVI